jgi:hypothetical protein
MLDRWRETGQRQVGVATLSHLTPMGFEHINFDRLCFHLIGIARGSFRRTRRPRPRQTKQSGESRDPR